MRSHTDFTEARRVWACVWICTVCLHSGFVLPSISEGGIISTHREVDLNRQQRSSVDLLMLCCILIHFACTLNVLWMHLSQKMDLDHEAIKNQQSIFYFFLENHNGQNFLMSLHSALSQDGQPLFLNFEAFSP